jgi:cell division protease FtsH
MKKLPPMKKMPLGQLLWIGLMVMLVFSFISRMGDGTPPIPYSQFVEYLDQNKLARVTVAGDTIHGELKDAPQGASKTFTTQRVPGDLASQLEKHGVEFSATQGAGAFSTLLSWIIPPLLFVGIWLVAMRFMGGGRGGGFGGGLLSMGRSKARLVAETDIKITFEDVAGVEEAKTELREIVDFLKHPEEFGRLGAVIPRGVLLVGPPGTGKTLLARAVAGEAGVPFFTATGAEFVEMFVGVGASRVRDLFEQARKSAPCIIFIDELDALGRARGANPMGGHDEKEQTLNQLLSEMDGFDRSVAVIILAATNRPEILDPALLRAGRFDRQVLVDRPERSGRIAILKVHVRKLHLANDVDLAEVAAQTPGFTGADLANLANEAAIRATRRGAVAIAMEDFTESIERIVAGLEKRSRVLIPRERRVVAYHEMGHAIVAMAIPGANPVQKISIIPRGIAALGYTMQQPGEDRYLIGRAELEARMAVLMGGRAAEMLISTDSGRTDVTTGASDDLAKATDTARGMVLRFGMDAGLGPVAWDTEQGQFLGQQGNFWSQRRYSEATAHAIDEAVRNLLRSALARAVGILETNRAALDEGAADLLANEVLTAETMPAVIPEAAPPPAIT